MKILARSTGLWNRGRGKGRGGEGLNAEETLAAPLVGVLILPHVQRKMGVGWVSSDGRRREKKMKWIEIQGGTTLGTTKNSPWKGDTCARALWGYRARTRVRPPLCLIVVREEKEGKPVHSIRVANAKRPLLQGRLRVRSPFGMRAYI